MNKIVTARHVSVPQNILKKVFKNVLAAGAPRRTPLEEFTALPIRPSWILGGEGEARRKYLYLAIKDVLSVNLHSVTRPIAYYYYYFYLFYYY